MKYRRAACLHVYHSRSRILKIIKSIYWFFFTTISYWKILYWLLWNHLISLQFQKVNSEFISYILVLKLEMFMLVSTRLCVLSFLQRRNSVCWAWCFVKKDLWSTDSFHQSKILLFKAHLGECLLPNSLSCWASSRVKKVSSRINCSKIFEGKKYVSFPSR